MPFEFKHCRNIKMQFKNNLGWESAVLVESICEHCRIFLFIVDMSGDKFTITDVRTYVQLVYVYIYICKYKMYKTYLTALSAEIDSPLDLFQDHFVIIVNFVRLLNIL
jgi:hypothetical protein